MNTAAQIRSFALAPTTKTISPSASPSYGRLLTHAAVLLARALASSVTADGFSAPYRVAMGFATGLYGKTECNPHLNQIQMWLLIRYVKLTSVVDAL